MSGRETSSGFEPLAAAPPGVAAPGGRVRRIS
jgi:hypothetical protein